MAGSNLSLSFLHDVWDVKHSVSEVSASGNNRRVRVVIEVRTKDHDSGRDGSYYVDCEDGDSVSKTNSVIPGRTQPYLTIYDDTFNVHVDPGQTYAETSLSFNVTFYSSTAGANRILNGSITKITGLSVIADLTFSELEDIYFGDPVSITWTPQSSSFSYQLKFVLGSFTHTIDRITPNQTTSYTYNEYKFPYEAAKQIPDSYYGEVSVTLTQYKNRTSTEVVGTPTTGSFYVALPDSDVPTLSDCTASFSNTNNTIKGWNIGLAGYSAVTLSASAEGVYGSTITSFEITGSYTANPIARYDERRGYYLEYTGEKFNESGNKDFYIICVDSRGRKSAPASIKDILIAQYSKPKITSITANKSDNGTASAADDKMTVTATWEYNTVGDRNSASAKVYYKETNAAYWTLHSGSILNGETFELTGMPLEDGKAYNIKVVVTDAIGEYDDKSAFASTTQVLLDFRAGGKGLGVGGICQKDGMEVQMDTTFYKGVNLLRDAETISIEDYIIELATTEINNSRLSIIGAIYPIGSIYISLNNGNPRTILGVGVWEQLEGRFLLGAGAYSESGATYSYSAGTTGGECMHTLTEDEMPSHNHWGVMRPSYDPIAGTHPSPVTDGKNINYLETNVTGGNMPHNNMPPYLAVYMWERVA